LSRYGDENQGFTVDVIGEAVVVTAFGFWSAELAAQLGSAVTPLLGVERRRAALIFDVGGLRPLRDEGQAALYALILHALAVGVSEVVVRASSALTKLQMLRIVRQIGRPSVRVE
jgi:hypothetical protein